MLEEYNGFKRGDTVISTLARQPSSPRVIKFFIDFGDCVHVFFDAEQDTPAVRSSPFRIDSWKLEEGLLKKANKD